MATRSRTALFCKYRDSLKTHRKTPLRGASGMLVEGRQTYNNDWCALKQQVESVSRPRRQQWRGLSSPWQLWRGLSSPHGSCREA